MTGQERTMDERQLTEEMEETEERDHERGAIARAVGRAFDEAYELGWERGRAAALAEHEAEVARLREALEQASEACRVNLTTWIALEHHLNTPYPGTNLSPWTRFGKRAADLAAEARRVARATLSGGTLGRAVRRRPTVADCRKCGCPKRYHDPGDGELVAPACYGAQDGRKCIVNIYHRFEEARGGE